MLGTESHAAGRGIRHDGVASGPGGGRKEYTDESGAVTKVIENRSLWKTDSERMLPGHAGSALHVFTHAGSVFTNRLFFRSSPIHG